MPQNWNLIERWLIPSVLVRNSLRFPHAHWCYSDKTESISLTLTKTVITTPKKKQQQQLSHPPSHTIIENAIRDNIAQMTSKSKACIPCLLATIIKWCHIINSMRQASTPWWWSLYIYSKLILQHNHTHAYLWIKQRLKFSKTQEKTPL